MSARSAVKQAAAKAVILFGALFLVSVLLAAMPNHHAPEVGQASQELVNTQSEDSRQTKQEIEKQEAGKHVSADQKIQ